MSKIANYSDIAKMIEEEAPEVKEKIEETKQDKPKRGRGRPKKNKTEDTTPDDDQQEHKEPLFLRIVDECNVQYFKDPTDPKGAVYVSIRMGDLQSSYMEHMAIDSSAFRLWMRKKVYEWSEGHLMPNSTYLNEAIQTILALRSELIESHKLHIRVAELDGCIYIDMCNDKREVIKINKDGWEIISNINCPVKFKKTNTMLPLPYPVRGGSMDELRNLVNVPERQWILFKTYLSYTSRPNNPFPIAIIQGLHGSAKSTHTEAVKMVIDPSTVLLRTLQKDDRELFISAKNSWVVAFDNLSGVSAKQADALCRLATGGSISTRALHTDDDEFTVSAMRAVVLNGIDDIATRADLADRSVVFNLPTIPDEERKSKEQFWSEFNEAHPRILGGLLDEVVKGLRNISSVKFDSLPRMADFAIWGTAIEEEAGSFMKAYKQNIHEAILTSAESNPFIQAVLSFMDNEKRWEGTAGTFYQELSQHVRDRVSHFEFPSASNKLTYFINRQLPTLNKLGIQIERLPKSKQGARYAIYWIFDEKNSNKNTNKYDDKSDGSDDQEIYRHPKKPRHIKESDDSDGSDDHFLFINIKNKEINKENSDEASNDGHFPVIKNKNKIIKNKEKKNGKKYKVIFPILFLKKNNRILSSLSSLPSQTLIQQAFQGDDSGDDKNDRHSLITQQEVCLLNLIRKMEDTNINSIVSIIAEKKKKTPLIRLNLTELEHFFYELNHAYHNIKRLSPEERTPFVQEYEKRFAPLYTEQIRFLH